MRLGRNVFCKIFSKSNISFSLILRDVHCVSHLPPGLDDPLDCDQQRLCAARLLLHGQHRPGHHDVYEHHPLLPASAQ